jgi:sarcosine reductase
MTSTAAQQIEQASAQTLLGRRPGSGEARFARAVHLVREAGFGERTQLRDGRLTVDAERALALVCDPALAAPRLTWAAPGDSVRIVKVLDVVEPRAKAPGGGGVFPGLLGPRRAQGAGVTHVLRGAAVLAAGHLPRAQEAVIEMSGPGQALSPFGATHNLVLEFEPAPDAGFAAVEQALRRALLRLAVHLAEGALDQPPSAYEHPPASRHRRGGDARPAGPAPRPRVAVIVNLQTQGAFKDVFVYGRSFVDALPSLIEPAELDDGAVVSGQYGHPALRNPTYVHQNNPLLEALAGEAERLELAGVLLCPEPVDQEGKELIAELAARACEALGAEGALIAKEGGGNADADVSLKLDALAQRGIAAVGLLAEMAGPDGTGPSLVFAPAAADGLISLGNYDERLALPACERALGGERLEVAGVSATAPVELPIAVHLASLNPLGAWRLSAAAKPAGDRVPAADATVSAA